jgi:hypothetical protein
METFYTLYFWQHIQYISIPYFIMKFLVFHKQFSITDTLVMRGGKQQHLEIRTMVEEIYIK